MLPARRPFTRVAQPHLAAMRAMLTDGGRLLTDADAVAPYNRDWLGQRVGHAPCVVAPRSTEEVKRVLAFCNAERIAVVPQAGNTGLVYGSVPVHDEIVLSLRDMRSVLAVDPDTFSATVDAGVVLHDLHVAATARGMTAPLDLGARGSCCLGGNISTNAGGIHFARYGSMRANTLGLRVVLADGTELDLMSSVRKDNTGYDLKQLFVGSEGTLGVITQAVVRLHPLARAVRVVTVRAPSFAAVLRLYHLAQAHVAEVLAAFEVMDAEGLAACGRAATMFDGSGASAGASAGASGGSGPGPGPLAAGEFAVLIETRGADEAHDMAKLLALLEAAMSEGVAVDSRVAGTAAQNAELWRAREEMPLRLAQLGAIFKFDLCSPLHQFYESADFARALIAERLPEATARGAIVVTSYGHFGDGNAHLNVVVRREGAPPGTLERMHEFLKPEVYGFAARGGASISAEHGVGEQKCALLRKYKPPAVMATMALLKRSLDPNGILNPYKVVDEGLAGLA